MFEQMKWENVYELWRMCGYQFSKVLTEPVSAETVFVEYRKRSFLVVVGLLTTTCCSRTHLQSFLYPAT